MHQATLPSLRDLGSLLYYVAGNPDLFIRQSTVMTSAIGILAATLTYTWRPRFLTRFLEVVAPTLVLVLGVFSLGALALSLEIWFRFHDSIPYESGVQLISGVEHFLVGAILIVALRPWIRNVGARDWVKARAVAGLYWTFQVAVLEPEWFSFQGQRTLILGLFWLAIVGHLILTYDRWRELQGLKSLLGPLPPREIKEG